MVQSNSYYKLGSFDPTEFTVQNSKGLWFWVAQNTGIRNSDIVAKLVELVLIYYQRTFKFRLRLVGLV